jgi:uncharacterized protein (DUF362 family)
MVPQKESTMTDITRRKFLKMVGLAGAGAALAACQPGDAPSAETDGPSSKTESPSSKTDSPSSKVEGPGSAADAAYLAIVRGADPAAITEAAVKAVGGMGHFVSAGDDVIVKPNICVNHNTYEYASTTNPTVVGTLVRLALEAGAKRVRVMDIPYTSDPQTAYKTSGIQDAVVEAGGEMELMPGVKFEKYDMPDGRDLKSWKIYRDIMETDVLINVPIAKHHGSTRLTLGCKNLMGVILGANQFHRNLHQRIADLNTVIRPALTVVDAVRILTAHGPGGGNLDDVEKLDTVIASPDIITADAYATTLFGLTADDIGYIRLGAEMGLGNADWSSVKIEEISL